MDLRKKYNNMLKLINKTKRILYKKYHDKLSESFNKNKPIKYSPLWAKNHYMKKRSIKKPCEFCKAMIDDTYLKKHLTQKVCLRFQKY